MHQIVEGLSDIGCKRETNEDSYAIDQDIGLYVVADGMGGHAAGEVASRQATHLVTDFIRGRQDEINAFRRVPGGYFKILGIAEEAVQKACREIYKLASSNREYSGMGTTVTVLLVVDTKAIMAHVGDSRLYILREGSAHQLSVDHTLAQEMLASGQLEPGDPLVRKYSHVLLRNVGTHESVQVDTLLFDLVPGDVCLLCSDGLSNYFKDPAEIVEHLGIANVEKAAGDLLQLALHRGGDDNITLIVARIASEESGDTTQDVAMATENVQIELDVLRSLPLFSGLSFRNLLRVRNIARLDELDAGETLCERDDSLDALRVLLDGRLTIRGREKKELTGGAYLGEAALVRDRKCGLSVHAVEPSRVLVITRERFLLLVHARPRLGIQLLGNLLESLHGRDNATAVDDGGFFARLFDWRRS